MPRLTLVMVSVIPILVYGNAFAQDRAVSAANGELSLSLVKFKFKNQDSDLNGELIGAQGNVPLGRYFGLNLDTSRSKLKQSGSVGVDQDTLTYSASPFWRDPKLGLVGVTVGRERSDLDFAGAQNRVTLKEKAINASAYIGPVTLSVSREKTTLTGALPPEFNIVLTDIVWYLSLDFLIDLSVGAQDAKKTYMLTFEHQLNDLPNLSYGLAYLRDTRDGSSGLAVTVTYRFAETKSLMRRYREDLFGVR